MKSIKKLIQQLPVFCLLFLLSTDSIAQQTASAVDSSLLDRINALEKQVAYNKPGEDHFMVVGLATFGFVAIKPPLLLQA